MILRSLFLFVACALSSTALALNEQNTALLNAAHADMKDLQVIGDDFIANTGSDGFLIFRDVEMSRDQACGIELDIEFKSAMPRPGIFEIFWRSAEQGFSEQRKAFVIINQSHTQARQRFMIPLCKLYHYSGNLNQPERQSIINALRFDYPTNKEIALRFHSIRLIDAETMNGQLQQSEPEIVILEPYERVSARSFASFDVALPKLYFAYEEGLQRISQDKPFLVVWLVMIAGLIVPMLRSVLRKERL